MGCNYYPSEESLSFKSRFSIVLSELLQITNVLSPFQETYKKPANVLQKGELSNFSH